MKKGILYSKGIEYYEKGNKKMKDILKKEKEMVEEYHIMIFGNKFCEGEFKEDLNSPSQNLFPKIIRL